MTNNEVAKKDWMTNIQSFFTSESKWRYPVLFILGATNVFAYAPYDVWFLPFITLSVLILSLSFDLTPKLAAKFGFSYGLGWFATGISWVHVAIADFGGLPLPISIILMALLDGYLALFPALACFIAVKFKPKLGLYALVPAWILTEWLRSVVLTGFPWLSIGYTQSSSWLSGWAPIIGEIGLQFIVLSLSLCLVMSFVNRVSLRKRIVTLGITVLFFLMGGVLSSLNWSTGPDKAVNISLVQGNIEQSIKWQPENEMPTMLQYLDLSRSEFKYADLIIWPEAAVPRLEIISNDFLREVDKLAAASDTALITGIVDYQPETKNAYNNLIVLGKKRPNDEFGHYKYLHSNRFNKHHLLPIGEFIPFESFLRGIAPLFDLPMSSFSRGTYQQDNLLANGLYLSPAICFEIAFSSQVRANLYNAKHQTSDILLTVSNDAWFGDTHGPWQHLQIAQMRALEYAKPVVRVTNNGVTAVIDAQGKIVNILPQFEQQVLRQQLTYQHAITPYQRFGDAPLYLLLSAFTAACFIRKRNKKIKNTELITSR